MDKQNVDQASVQIPAHRARAFVADVGALGVLQVLMRLQGLVLLPVISRGFGTEAYGIWSQFFVATQLVSILVSLSLDDPLVRFVSGARTREEQSEHYHAMLAMVVGANIVAALVLLMAPGQFAYLLLGNAQYAPFVLLMAPTLVFEAIDDATLNMLRALHRAKLYAALEASQAITRIVVIAATLLFSHSLLTAIVANMGVQLVWLLAQLALNYHFVGFKWPSFKYIRESLAYSLPLVPTRYSNIILNYSDRLVITHVWGPAAVGIYAASYDLARLCWHVVLPLRMALQPVVSRLWDEGRRAEVSLLLSQSFKYSLVLGLPAVVGLSALAPRLLGLLSTNAFVAASYAIVPLAAGGILLNGIAGVFASVMRLHKNTRAIAAAVTLAAVLHLALNFILIPAFGIVGGAIATFIGYGLELGFMIFQSWRHTRFPLPLRASLVSIVASALMLPVVIWIGSWNGWLGLIVAIGAGAAVYGAALLLLGGITLKEVRVVLKGSAA